MGRLHRSPFALLGEAKWATVLPPLRGRQVGVRDDAGVVVLANGKGDRRTRGVHVAGQRTAGRQRALYRSGICAAKFGGLARMVARPKGLYAPVDRRTSGRRCRPLDRSGGMRAGGTWFLPVTDSDSTAAGNFSERRMQYGRAKCQQGNPGWQTRRRCRNQTYPKRYAGFARIAGDEPAVDGLREAGARRDRLDLHRALEQGEPCRVLNKRHETVRRGANPNPLLRG